MRGPQTQSGFTLLEVLVAFAICALLLGGFLQVFSNGLHQSRVANAVSIATLHADSLISAVGKIDAVIEGEREGQIDDDFRWKLSMRRYEEEEADFDQAPLTPYQVTMTVLWMEGEMERSVSLSTLRLAKPE